MTTDAGRKTVAYLVRCALASNDTLVKQDQNDVAYTFAGGLGLCPHWKYGERRTSDRTCQNMLSACLMAHINTAGVHVPLWIDSASPAIGWGTSSSYPMQEGTFFGNIIETGDLRTSACRRHRARWRTSARAPASATASSPAASARGQPARPTRTRSAMNVNLRDNEPGRPADPTSHGTTAPDGFKAGVRNELLLPERRAAHRVARPRRTRRCSTRPTATPSRRCRRPASRWTSPTARPTTAPPSSSGTAGAVTGRSSRSRRRARPGGSR